MLQKLLSITTSIFITGSALAHEVSVDTPFSPKEEIAGVDFPPYALDAFYDGEAGELFSRSECYISQDRLRNYAIGQWIENPTEDPERLVCAIIMLAGGPQRLIDSGARAPHPDFLKSTTLSVLLLADIFRAPYNLSAVEAISGTLVVLGGLSPTDRRALLRAVLE
ncbi:hypothetical protein [Yoonia sp. R2-816]|uniref:hypothetical protein n=1 Tax=Yoonia sp. R2-816 TaxID=3342638 RepID=UPI0037299010